MPPTTKSPQVFEQMPDLVEHLLAGGAIDAHDFKIVMQKYADESQWHDFKSGKIAEDGRKQKPGRRLRELLASFANSEGGVVFVGVATKGAGDSRELVVDGYQGKNGQTWQEWLANELQNEWSRYSPSPKHGEFIVSDEDTSTSVVWVAVGAQEHYVYVNGALWFRLPDGSKKAPDYLVGDLLLGKRRRPQLVIEARRPNFEISADLSMFQVEFTVSNAGFVDAGELHLGVVHYSDGAAEDEGIPVGVRPFVDLRPPSPRPGLDPPQLCVVTEPGRFTNGIALRPLTHTRWAISLYRPSTKQAWLSRCALYLLPIGHPPLWYQLTITASAMERTPVFRSPDNVSFRQLCQATVSIEKARLPLVEWLTR